PEKIQFVGGILSVQSLFPCHTQVWMVRQPCGAEVPQPLEGDELPADGAPGLAEPPHASGPPAIDVVQPHSGASAQNAVIDDVGHDPVRHYSATFVGFSGTIGHSSHPDPQAVSRQAM